METSPFVSLQILTYTRDFCSLACHTYCETTHPFKMVISKDPWHIHSGAVNTCFLRQIGRVWDWNNQLSTCGANALPESATAAAFNIIDFFSKAVKGVLVSCSLNVCFSRPRLDLIYSLAWITHASPSSMEASTSSLKADHSTNMSMFYLTCALSCSIGNWNFTRKKMNLFTVKPACHSYVELDAELAARSSD